MNWQTCISATAQLTRMHSQLRGFIQSVSSMQLTKPCVLYKCELSYPLDRDGEVKRVDIDEMCTNTSLKMKC
ncbi:hypothetical protein PR048_022312 [Dryococelus australis]|uniref:Uncharacterized protein n=1 Tax=Dryococelus australis TaxID=614101 RepID=A0ABQ9H0Y0_9NEOP|nr:hypothetical protein PR048_022312 [Dryococelus australis]